MKRYRELSVALLVQALGAGAALLLAAQTWQRLTAAREGPFATVQVSMTGRDVDPAGTALALVALAGVVALLATKGRWRRLVGMVVALAGGFMIVRALLSIGAVSAGRAQSFIAERRQTVSTPADTRVTIETVTAWPVLSALCGLLVLVAGGLVAVRGGRWQGMSARYERERPPAPVTDAVTDTPEDAAEREGKAAATMWTALDRGDDPTTS